MDEALSTTRRAYFHNPGRPGAWSSLRAAALRNGLDPLSFFVPERSEDEWFSLLANWSCHKSLKTSSKFAPEVAALSWDHRFVAWTVPESPSEDRLCIAAWEGGDLLYEDRTSSVNRLEFYGPELMVENRDGCSYWTEEDAKELRPIGHGQARLAGLQPGGWLVQNRTNGQVLTWPGEEELGRLDPSWALLSAYPDCNQALVSFAELGAEPYSHGIPATFVSFKDGGSVGDRVLRELLAFHPTLPLAIFHEPRRGSRQHGLVLHDQVSGRQQPQSLAPENFSWDQAVFSKMGKALFFFAAGWPHRMVFGEEPLIGISTSRFSPPAAVWGRLGVGWHPHCGAAAIESAQSEAGLITSRSDRLLTYPGALFQTFSRTGSAALLCRERPNGFCLELWCDS